MLGDRQIVGSVGATTSLFQIRADADAGSSHHMYAIGYNEDAIIPYYANVKYTIGPTLGGPYSGNKTDADPLGDRGLLHI